MIKRFKAQSNASSHLKEMLTGSAITFVLKISGMLLGYLVVILVSRRYGTEGVGVYNLTFSTMMFVAMVASMGMNVSILRYVGQFNKSGEKYKLKHLYRYALEFIVPFSLLLAGILYFFSDTIAQNIFHNPAYKTALEFSAFIVPFLALQNVSVEFIRGLKKLKVSEYLRSVNQPLINISLLLIVGNLVFLTNKVNDIFCTSLGLCDQMSFIYNSLSISNLFQQETSFNSSFLERVDLSDMFLPIVTLGLGIIGSALFAVWYSVKKTSKIESKRTTEFSRKELVTTSMPMLVAGVASFILGNIPLFLLEVISSTDEVGLYSVSLKIANLIGLVLVVVNTIAAPKFSELYWDKKYVELQKVISHSTRLIFFSSLSIAIVLMIFANEILSVFGDNFVDGYIALFLLILGQLINSATGSVGIFLNMTGHQKVIKNIVVISALVTVPLAYVLIMKYGINGAAFSYLFGMAVLNIAAVIFIKLKLGYIMYYTPFTKKLN